MATIRVETNIKYTDLNGNPVTVPVIGTAATPLIQVERREYTLTTATRRVIWDPVVNVNENPLTFAFLALWANGPSVDVEFLADQANLTTHNQAWTHRLYTNIPLMLGADDTYVGASHTELFAAGTLNKIQQLSLQNNSGATRIVTMLIGSL